MVNGGEALRRESRAMHHVVDRKRHIRSEWKAEAGDLGKHRVIAIIEGLASAVNALTLAVTEVNPDRPKFNPLDDVRRERSYRRESALEVGGSTPSTLLNLSAAGRARETSTNITRRLNESLVVEDDRSAAMRTGKHLGPDCVVNRGFEAIRGRRPIHPAQLAVEPVQECRTRLIEGLDVYRNRHAARVESGVRGEIVQDGAARAPAGARAPG